MDTQSKRDAAKETVHTVTEIYERARIPTLKPNKMAEEIFKVHTKMLNILKKSEDIWEIPGQVRDNVKEFQEQLQQTQQFWPRDVLDQIQNQEDNFFFIYC